MEKLVSVIIPVYNIGHLITETIDSVLRQTYTDFEIIIIDDGSTDETARHIKCYQDSRLIYRYQENSGLPSKARGAGIQLSRGEYIAFLDHDDVWMPHKLEKQVSIMQSDPRIALVSSNGIYITMMGSTKKPIFSGLKDGYFNKSNLFPTSKVIQSSVMMRKSIFDELGGFNNAKDLIAREDYDLWIRTFAKYPCYYIDELLVYYRFINHSVSMGGGRIALERSLNYFKKYFPRDLFSQEIYTEAVSRILYELSYHQYLVGNERFADSLQEASSMHKNGYYYILKFLFILPQDLLFKVHQCLRKWRYEYL